MRGHSIAIILLSGLLFLLGNCTPAQKIKMDLLIPIESKAVLPALHRLARREEKEEMKIVLKPNQTMWDLFEDKVKEDLVKWKEDPGMMLLKAPVVVLTFVKDVIAELFKLSGSIVQWFGKGIEHPTEAWKDIRKFANETGTGLKLIWKNMKIQPKATFQNVFGGMLYNIYTNSVEWTAETALLLIGAKFFFEGLKSVMSNVASETAIINTVIFLHCLDDPILMLPTILAGINASTDIEEGKGQSNTTTNSPSSPTQKPNPSNHTTFPVVNLNSTVPETFIISNAQLDELRTLHCNATVSAANNLPHLLEFKKAMEREAARTQSVLNIDDAVNQICMKFFNLMKEKLKEKSENFSKPVEIPVMKPMQK